ncbi:hypothetical protein GBA65_00485 [Rubrobacter marinus]|uniref:Uncharacterized protein n=1 Tax=Rubrobacter marinus TaxID=2653852 RepID=A0A6G8PT33_9ACTN|nr:phage holin family protein [Rubrobacter marinus]QIN77242.1 hypothetical protein GBA65_00485 [Rubrobacter marinus]
MTQQQDRVENFTRELRQDRPASDRSIGEIFNALRPRLQELLNKQIELARAELTPVGRKAGIAIGLLVVGPCSCCSSWASSSRRSRRH